MTNQIKKHETALNFKKKLISTNEDNKFLPIFLFLNNSRLFYPRFPSLNFKLAQRLNRKKLRSRKFLALVEDFARAPSQPRRSMTPEMSEAKGRGRCQSPGGRAPQTSSPTGVASPPQIEL